MASPRTEVKQDLFEHLDVIDYGDDPHLPMTLGTNKKGDLIDLRWN